MAPSPECLFAHPPPSRRITFVLVPRTPDTVLQEEQPHCLALPVSVIDSFQNEEARIQDGMTRWLGARQSFGAAAGCLSLRSLRSLPLLMTMLPAPLLRILGSLYFHPITHSLTHSFSYRYRLPWLSSVSTATRYLILSFLVSFPIVGLATLDDSRRFSNDARWQLALSLNTGYIPRQLGSSTARSLR